MCMLEPSNVAAAHKAFKIASYFVCPIIPRNLYRLSPLERRTLQRAKSVADADIIYGGNIG